MTTGTGGPRIGVLGGSFDPIHHGHLVAAQDVLERLALDQLLLIPARRTPHKLEGCVAPAPARLAMVRAAVRGHPHLGVSEIEMERPGPSWTVDTLRGLVTAHPGAEFHLILGADQWRAFGRWREPREVARLAELVLMSRAGDRPVDIDPGMEDGPPPPYRDVEVTRCDISSTGIRDRVRQGRSIRFLVPEGVRRIIEGEKLYR
jgi:nicotinate-nucleotide adenylyltransferase